jgi:hypothetical protein
MSSLLIACFLTELRRLLTTVLASLLIISSSMLLVSYIDDRCAHLGLALLSIFVWIVVIAGAWWIILMSLSPRLILPAVLRDWVLERRGGLSRTEQEAHERLAEIGLELPPIDPNDPRHFKINAELRFRFLFFFGVLGCMLVTHVTHRKFLTRFQKVGIPIIQLRSDDSIIRLKGLNMIVDQGQHHLITENRWRHRSVSSALESVIVDVLSDPNEGVRARAAFVSGVLGSSAAVPVLKSITLEDESLGEVALLALGAMPVQPLKAHPASQAIRELALSPTVAHAQPLALAIAIGQQRLPLGDTLAKIYKTHLKTGVSSSSSEKSRVHSDDYQESKVREAAIWALGELRNKEHLSAVAIALQDPALSVRCLAGLSLEKMITFDSSRPLRHAFEVSQKNERCPQIVAPHQEGVKPLVLIGKIGYQLTLIRALATTDDPELLQWMYDQDQKDLEAKAHHLMRKYHKKLTERDRKGLLESFKRQIKRRKRLEKRAQNQ